MAMLQAMPKKRGWGDDGHSGPTPSKAPHVAGPPGGKGGKGGNHYAEPPSKGTGAPTSKAMPTQAPAMDKGSPPSKGGFPDKGKGKMVQVFGSEGKGAKHAASDAGESCKGDKGDFGKGNGSAKGGKGGKEEEHDASEASWNMQPTPEERKQAVAADRLLPSPGQASIDFFKTSGVDIELALLTEKLRPSDEARRSAQRCLALARSAVSAHWGHQSGSDVPSISMSGSYAQGTEVHGSAMELAFRLPASFSSADRANCVSELRNRLSQQTDLLQVCCTMQHYPHTTSPLAIDLIGAQPPLVGHIVLEELRIDRPPTLDEVIKQMCDSCEASYDLVRLVKVWTVNHGLANQQEGFINGVAWTLLVIFFLQKSGLIKPYSVLSRGEQGPPVASSPPLSTLLLNFFDFLAQRNAAPRGISLWTGAEFEGPSAVFVEDPAHFLETGTQRSVSESLVEQQWNRILDAATKAFSRIRVRPGRWFHWAEVFDPTERKPAKIHGLGAHLGAPLSAPLTGDGKGGPDGDAKGMGKYAGKGAPFSGSGNDDSKGLSKDSGSKGCNDSDKGYGKDYSGGKDSGGKDYGCGKDYGGGKGAKDVGKGKDYGCGKAHGGGKDHGNGKDYGNGKGYGKPY